MTAGQSNNLWLFLELLANRKALILTIVFLVTLAAIVVSLVLPKYYTATAVLLPPKSLTISSAKMGNWSDMLSVTAGLNLPVRATPSDIYVRMLNSRSVTGRVIERFNLAERYGTATFEETYMALMEHADLRVSEEGLLVVAVEDREPQVAADMANAFVEELGNVNAKIVADRIGQTRTFLSERLVQVKAELDSSRHQLEMFQMKYKTVDFNEQTRLAIEQATALKVKLSEIELELHMSELTLGEDNAKLIQLERQRTIVKNQLRKLETENADSSFFSLPIASIPSLKGEYEVLYSKVRVGEVLYGVLLEQSEQAKVKEYETMPTISVLDSAEVPTLRSRPRRTLIVGASFSLAIIFAIFLAACVEYLSRMRHSNPKDYDRLMAFVSAFFGWLPGVGKVQRSTRKRSTDNTQREYDVNIDN